MLAPPKRVVLITGCSEGGMGYEFAKAFAAKGCTVFATARKLDAMAGLKEAGVAACLVLDVDKGEDRERVVKEVIATAGGIDVLVNNAGFSTGIKAVIDYNEAEEHKLFDTNFWGAVSMCQLVGRHMAQRGSGHIINNGSMASFQTVPLLGFYSATKAALEAITHALRQEMAPFGVKVTYLAPGFVRTKIGAQPGFVAAAQESAWGTSMLAPMYAAVRQSLQNLTIKYKGGMDPEAFAEQFVTAMLRPSPPLVWWGGDMSSNLIWSSWLLSQSWQDFLRAHTLDIRGLKIKAGPGNDVRA